jgi:hypothetical protein
VGDMEFRTMHKERGNSNKHTDRTKRDGTREERNWEVK